MRKLLVLSSVSLDGYMEAPGHDISWHVVGDELHHHINETLAETGVFVHGRRSWELMASVWPTLDQDPSQPESMRAFAPIWRDMPKLVYSRTLTEVGWNAELRREVDPDEIRALKAAAGGDIVVGGANLAATFFAHDLVDELRLHVMPVLLGAGTPAFPAAGAVKHWQLAESRTFEGGVVMLRYERGDTQA
jgi:dihydrofolate reductase